MKFALPCNYPLVERGTWPQSKIDALLNQIKSRKPFDGSVEKMFPVAMASCTLIARSRGMKSINLALVYEYFLLKHDEAVIKRYLEVKDFDPITCLTRVGVVKSVKDGKAIVANSNGLKSYRTDYAPGLRVGDEAITHWDFVVEKVDESNRSWVLKAKELRIPEVD